MYHSFCMINYYQKSNIGKTQLCDNPSHSFMHLKQIGYYAFINCRWLLCWGKTNSTNSGLLWSLYNILFGLEFMIKEVGIVCRRFWKEFVFQKRAESFFGRQNQIALVILFFLFELSLFVFHFLCCFFHSSCYGLTWLFMISICENISSIWFSRSILCLLRYFRN